MSCGVGCRRGLDPTLLWLWRRPVATAPTGPLAWEPPYAAGAAQETAKKKKKLMCSSVSKWKPVSTYLSGQDEIKYPSLVKIIPENKIRKSSVQPRGEKPTCGIIPPPQPVLTTVEVLGGLWFPRGKKSHTDLMGCAVSSSSRQQAQP